MSDLIDSLSRNLRGYWCPMLQHGGLTLRDQTRFKNHGTLTNMDVSTDWVMSKVKGRSGRVLDFDGVNDKVVGATNRDFRLLSGSVWVNPRSTVNSASSAQGVVQFRFGSNNTGSIEFGASTVFLTNEYITLISTPSSYRRGVTDGGSLVAGEWSHIVWTWSGADYDFYVNGSLRTSSTNGTPAIQTGNTFLLGCESGQSAGVDTRFFDGQIAESAFWSRSLPVSDIRELYRLGPGWYQPQLPRRIPYSEQQAGFRAYWARRQSQLIGGGV